MVLIGGSMNPIEIMSMKFYKIEIESEDGAEDCEESFIENAEVEDIE